jgi:predicted dehydrogenase
MINVAIIGFGFMGITHAINIQRNKRLNLAAIITRDVDGIAAKLNQQAGNFSGGQIDAGAILQIPAYKSLRQCVKSQKIDAVHICVHTDLHFEIAKEAIEMGLHVFLEKPMTLRINDGTLLIAFAKQQNIKLMVGHVVRFMPAYEKLKDWIDIKTFGALKFVSLTRFTGLPSWGQWKEKQHNFGSSGGALFDLVVHDIDFLQSALGPPEKIEAITYPGLLSMHDFVSAHWSYRGIKAKIEGGNIFHSTYPFQAGYMARFDDATVVYSTLKPANIEICSGEKIELVPAGDANDGFYNEIDYFAMCIENDLEPIKCTPASALQTIRLCYDHM